MYFFFLSPPNGLNTTLVVHQLYEILSILGARIRTEKQYEEFPPFLQHIFPECKFVVVCIVGIAQDFACALSALILSPSYYSDILVGFFVALSTIDYFTYFK